MSARDEAPLCPDGNSDGPAVSFDEPRERMFVDMDTFWATFQSLGLAEE